MAHRTTQIHLAARPTDALTAGDFSLVEIDLPEPGPGEVLIQNHWMSVDPYMRRRMNGGRFYMPPFQVGKPLAGGAVGEVVASGSPDLPVGSWVQHMAGWCDHALIPARRASPIDPDLAPASAYLGVLGMPGLTAYVGLLDVAGLCEGDTVFVSGAAGAVGSLAGQLAKLRGHRVIGSAGTPAKVAWLRDELGFDAAFDYHDGPVNDLLGAVAPHGIDVYFDNVGYDHLEAAITHANDHARFALCGTIADYDQATPKPGPANLFEVVARRIRMQGFIISDHRDRQDAMVSEVAPLVRSGAVKHIETIVRGLDNAPAALMGLFEGASTGKMLVQLT